MKVKTVTVREGELLGPVDYTYNFSWHFDNYCCTEERKREYCDRAVMLLRQAEEAFRAGKQVTVAIGEWRHRLLDVGMYDGWPYWRPTPALLCSGTLGAEWHFFNDLREVIIKD